MAFIGVRGWKTIHSTSFQLPAHQLSLHRRRFQCAAAMFKENGGEKPMPSIYELAKQQELKDLMQQYKNNIDRRVFDDVIQFPCEFLVKIIGVNDATFLDDTLAVVSKCVDQTPSAIKCSTKVTSGGKYLSISLSPVFTQSSQIYEAYDLISRDARVKFMI